MSDLPYKDNTKTRITISPLTIEVETSTDSSEAPMPNESFMSWLTQAAKVIMDKLNAIHGEHLCGFPDPEGLKCQLPAGHEGPHRTQGV